MKTQAEIGVMYLQVKECQGSDTHQKLGERHGLDFFLEPPEGASLVPTPSV